MLDLFKAIGLGLVVLLPLANPLTTVALFLGLAGNMNSAERNRQSLMASVYVFAIMMVAYYAGQLVMDTFGISIPGLRIAGGLIVAFIGFRMLFPQQKAIDSPEAKSKSEELEDEPSAPKTIASAVPVAIKLNACARFPAGAIRIARDAVIDQKIACAKATPMRLITRTVKLHDKNDSTWLAINTTNRQISNLRRST